MSETSYDNSDDMGAALERLTRHSHAIDFLMGILKQAREDDRKLRKPDGSQGRDRRFAQRVTHGTPHYPFSYETALLRPKRDPFAGKHDTRVVVLHFALETVDPDERKQEKHQVVMTVEAMGEDKQTCLYNSLGKYPIHSADDFEVKDQELVGAQQPEAAEEFDPDELIAFLGDFEWVPHLPPSFYEPDEEQAS